MVKFQYNLIADVLQNSKKVILIDGGLGTELEQRKVNINSLLWSSVALVEAADDVTKLHYDYYHSGANVGITCSYQCSEDSLKASDKEKYSSKESRLQVYKESVEVCKRAKIMRMADAKAIELLVSPEIAGSIGPFGSFLNDGSEFTGGYERSEDEYQAFHEEKLDFFMNGTEEVDYLQLETMPNFEEIKALLMLIKRKNSERKETQGKSEKRFILSLSIRNEEQLADGTPLKAVVKYLHDVGYLSKDPKTTPLMAVGANCLKLKYSVKFVENLTNYMNELQIYGFPISIYPNSGEIYDGIKKNWIFDQSNEKYYTTNVNGEKVCDWKILLDAWIASGAKIIGGCCRVGVRDIVEMNKVVLEYNKSC